MQAAGVSAAGRPASWLETRHSHTETVYLCMLLRERYLAPKVKTRRALTRKAASSAAAVPADVTLMLPDDLLLMLVRCAAATTLTGTLSTAPQLHRPRRHPHESHHIRLRPRRHPHRLRLLPLLLRRQPHRLRRQPHRLVDVSGARYEVRLQLQLGEQCDMCRYYHRAKLDEGRRHATSAAAMSRPRPRALTGAPSKYEVAPARFATGDTVRHNPFS